jgi:hypothetical protein
LKQFYRLKSPSPSAEDEDQEDRFVDYARGEGLLESSGSEDEDDDGEEEESDEEEIIEMGSLKKRAIPGRVAEFSGSEDGESDSDDDDNLRVDLSEGDEDEPPLEARPPIVESAFADEEGTQSIEEDGEIIDPTRRFAVVNMDWDNMRAIDLYTVFSSVLASAQQLQGSSRGRGDESVVVPVGKLLKVNVYPSEFGKERMTKEEAEGPSAEVFAASARPEYKGKGKQIELRPRGSSAKSSRRVATVDTDDQENDEEGEDFSESELEDDMTDIGTDDDLEDAEGDESVEDDGMDNILGKVKYDSEPDDDLESLDGDDGVDMDKLRNYQLERLR